jgi:hypothetical protein
MKLTIVFAALIMIGVGACWQQTSEPITRDDVIGVYKPNYLENASEEIVVLDNGTYQHTYQPAGDSLRMQTGGWELVDEQGRRDRPRIRFNDFINWYPLDANCYSTDRRAALDTLPHGWMPYIVKQDKDLIRISRCPDDEQYYDFQQ